MGRPSPPQCAHWGTSPRGRGKGGGRLVALGSPLGGAGWPEARLRGRPPLNRPDRKGIPGSDLYDRKKEWPNASTGKGAASRYDTAGAKAAVFIPAKISNKDIQAADH